MELFHIETELVDIKSFSKRYSIKDIFDGSIPKEYKDEIEKILFLMKRYNILSIPITLMGYIANDIKIDGINDFFYETKEYLDRTISNSHFWEYYFFELLIYIYDPAPELIQIEENVLEKIEGIEFDKDELINVRSGRYIIKKEGLIYKDYYLLYNKYMPGDFFSHGFVSDLIHFYDDNKKGITEFGLSLYKHIILNKKYWMDTMTKAYIRGPKGLSEEILNSNNFPEDISGTVSEHKRIYEDELMDLICPVDRIEVMWSYRDQLKSVQIEELKPRIEEQDYYYCKYIHSQWDYKKSKMVHFDGAIRNYIEDEYQDRISTDLKKFKGKAKRYYKLFKINGEIDLQSWCCLVTKYYDPNELIIEYFGGYDE